MKSDSTKKPIIIALVLGTIAVAVFTVLPILLLQKWSDEAKKFDSNLTNCSQDLCQKQVEELRVALEARLKNLQIKKVSYRKAGVFLDGTSDQVDVEVQNESALTDDDIASIYELVWKSGIYPLFSVFISSQEYRNTKATGAESYDSTILDGYKDDSEFKHKYGERRPGLLR